MTIQVKCPKCSKVYKLKDDFAGKKIRCKDCEAMIAVPKPKEEKVEEEADLDLGSLNLAQEERTARAYKKRPVNENETKKKKTDEEKIDHEQTDHMLRNLGKFAGIILAAHFASFGISYFMFWMQYYDYVRFFGYMYFLTLGLTMLSGVGSMIASLIWFLALSFKEHPKFFVGNLILGLLSWPPINLLIALGIRFLIRYLVAEENFEDRIMDYFKPKLIAIVAVGVICAGFPVYYIVTRWERVSRSLYLGFIGTGVMVVFSATYSLIGYLHILDKMMALEEPKP
ncbi:MAG: hypothetical protein ACKVT0_10645 [Planctomycetaceae bacterium]